MSVIYTGPESKSGQRRIPARTAVVTVEEAGPTGATILGTRNRCNFISSWLFRRLGISSVSLNPGDKLLITCEVRKRNGKAAGVKK